jgi:hypothetical protein
MTDQERPAPDHQGHLTDSQAHPERAVDELEERVLGQRMDQVRDADDETGPPVERARDEPGPGPTEQP